MAEVDTSSYPKAVQPPSFLDVASKFGNLQQQQQQIQSNQIGISRQNLDLINQRFSLVAKQMPGLLSKPDLNQDDVTNFYGNMVKEGWMTPEMAATEIGQIPSTQGMPPAQAALTIKNHLSNKMSIAQNMMDAINYHLGEKGFMNDQAGITPTLSTNKPGGVGGSGSSVVASGPTTPVQPPPTTGTVAPGGTVDANGNPIARGTSQILGPKVVPPNLPTNQPPSGSMFPYPPGTSPPQIMSAPGTPDGGSKLPVANAPGSAPNRPSGNAPITTGMPPMYENGRKLMESDQNTSNAKLQNLVPVEQAIPLLKNLTTGVGTEKFNEIVSGLKNIGFLPAATPNDPAVIYQEVKKKLNQYVQGNPVGQRSDSAQALSENSSPSIGKLLNPALVQLAKDSVAQDRMIAAMPHAFSYEQGNGQDLENYGNFRSEYPTKVDPKAFALDFMDDDDRNKLIDQNVRNLSSTNSRIKLQAQKFVRSLRLIKNLNILPSEQ